MKFIPFHFKKGNILLRSAESRDLAGTFAGTLVKITLEKFPQLVTIFS